MEEKGKRDTEGRKGETDGVEMGEERKGREGKKDVAKEGKGEEEGRQIG